LKFNDVGEEKDNYRRGERHHLTLVLDWEAEDGDGHGIVELVVRVPSSMGTVPSATQHAGRGHTLARLVQGPQQPEVGH